MRHIHGVDVHGLEVDGATRCAHYHSALDVVAIRFACCDRYYPCHECHRAVADHPPEVWPLARFDEPAVLCGACGRLMTPPQYFACEDRCPGCHSGFNPGCRSHRALYFAIGA